MMVEQFVMAYQVEHDRIRAMLPEAYTSLRPVLRINTEIRDGKEIYIEFNTPVASEGKRGWLNIDKWNSNICMSISGKYTNIDTPFLHIDYKAAGILGGCPAELDNDGCFYLGEKPAFKPAEVLTERKEFCDCSFAWKFKKNDAHGKSARVTLPAYPEEVSTEYPHIPLTAKNAASIPCIQVLGTYIIRFER